MTITVPPSATSKPTRSTGKEKKIKNFFEHGKDALELATLIAATEEKKQLSRAERHHRPQAGQPKPKQTDHKISSKDKLKEMKTIIAAQRAQSKKEKVKLRKEKHKTCQDNSGTSHTGASNNAKGPGLRKKVSFA
ncbi:hypothetical protein SERLA73DRAFT_186191 [Serpula lacrymans var. lacrymans S7.3]|uniref:Uncharacterized protein n=2 Tax=Serpula lacrymans var. lacrymans TaxID=341189 RepID=F8Q5I2_SERL3|nr:uncharacterized protein SERLADRAFT_475105 [Serpula lacrymans var. lacrymans S7.9]EGN96453.1 hypothetical protein SERLA73DRAFT_186191 [Serpula lacrymans var. lacrymans S7.3]EGO22001.1 hypothetical protein SERLADRAFT_475105 [Serpula lacrymans var. lacrymans S7.9]